MTTHSGAALEHRNGPGVGASPPPRAPRVSRPTSRSLSVLGSFTEPSVSFFAAPELRAGALVPPVDLPDALPPFSLSPECACRPPPFSASLSLTSLSLWSPFSGLSDLPPRCSSASRSLLLGPGSSAQTRQILRSLFSGYRYNCAGRLCCTKL